MCDSAWQLTGNIRGEAEQLERLALERGGGVMRQRHLVKGEGGEILQQRLEAVHGRAGAPRRSSSSNNSGARAWRMCHST